MPGIRARPLRITACVQLAGDGADSTRGQGKHWLHSPSDERPRGRPAQDQGFGIHTELQALNSKSSPVHGQAETDIGDALRCGHWVFSGVSRGEREKHLCLSFCPPFIDRNCATGKQTEGSDSVTGHSKAPGLHAFPGRLGPTARAESAERLRVLVPVFLWNKPAEHIIVCGVQWIS